MIVGADYIYCSIQKTGTHSVRHWLLKHYAGAPFAPYHSMYIPPALTTTPHKYVLTKQDKALVQRLFPEDFELLGYDA